MSKDPAILFYTGDFLNGCTDLTFEERGQYITLLCLQHQKGHLSEKTIRLSVGSVNGDVMKKFTKDENGNYYQERMEEEIDKRQHFLDTRYFNGTKGGRPVKPNKKANNKPNRKPTNNLSINDNENRNRIKSKDKIFVPPTIEEVKQYFKESGYTEESAVLAFDYYTDLDWYDKNDNPVLNWKIKMRTVWFKDEHKLQEQTDFSLLDDIMKTLKK